MKTPYGLQVIESCLTCPLVKDRIFCDLPQPVLAGLDAISSPATYPKDAVLFVEGQKPRGVYVLCNGRIKLTTSSGDGRSIVARIAEPGEIVGLVSTLSGKEYELTAEALEPLQTNFIPRDAFLQYLHQHGSVSLRVAEILSNIYRNTLMEVRYLGLSSSTTEKLARFIVDLPAKPLPNKGQFRATLSLTHREIGEIIGASRETVTRLFSQFKREGLIEIRGANLILTNKPKIEKLLEGS
jgi:CRP/FNR family transcriptional regulator, cyclic AMP receptor protein